MGLLLCCKRQYELSGLNKMEDIYICITSLFQVSVDKVMVQPYGKCVDLAKC